MALLQVGRPRIASECLGDSLAEPSKFSLRGFKRFLRDVTGVNFSHDGYPRISHHKHALCPNSFMLWTRRTSFAQGVLVSSFLRVRRKRANLSESYRHSQAIRAASKAKRVKA